MLRSEDGEQAMQVRQTVCVQAQQPTAFAPGYCDQGVRVRLYGQGANPFDITAGHKTLNYWARLRELREAAAAGAAEAIWLAPTNHLACGCVSNLFLVRDGVLQTPLARGEEPPGGMPMGVLPGVTRAALLELAEEMAIPTERRMLAIDDLLDADEVFLTNSSWRVLPVKAVERKSIGGGAPGPVTRRLRSVLLRRIDAETARDTTGA